MSLSLKAVVLSALLFANSISGHCLSKRQTSILTGNGTQYAPLPESIDEAEIGPEGYAIESFGGGAYMVTDTFWQALFLVSGKGVILVDAPEAMTGSLKKAIGSVTDEPVKKLIYSHGHTDHIAAAHVFAGPDVELIAHEDTSEYLAQISDPSRPLPNTTFKDKKTVKLGNQTLELEYKGPNHQHGNIFIYAPQQKILMLVDVILPKWVPGYQLVLADSIPGFFRAHDQALEYDFEHFVPGHFSRSGSREDVEVQKEYFRELFFACREIAYGGYDVSESVGPVVEKNPGNYLALFKATFTAQAQACSDAVTPKWIGRLAAADVFGFDNAYKIIVGLVVDYSRTTPIPPGFQS